MKGAAAKILLVMLMLVSYLLCIVAYKNLRGIQDTVTIIGNSASEEKMNESMYKNISEQEAEKEIPTDFAMWQENDGSVVRAVNSGRSTESTVLKIRGKTSVVFGGFAPLTEEDSEGCCLDEQIALELFGSTDVYGSQLEYEEKTYTVRGVLKDYNGLIVIRPRAGEPTGRITIKTSEDTASSSQSREFMAQYGITGKVLNHVMLKESIQIFPVLLPLCIGIWLLFSIRRTVKRDIQGRGERYLCYGMLFLSLIVLAATLIKFIQIPRDMIPTRWSDFQFWSNWFDNFREQISVYIRYSKGKTEMELLWIFIRCAAFGILPLLLLMGVGLPRRQPKRKF